jgi:Ca-activated chloride channel homolog
MRLRAALFAVLITQAVAVAQQGPTFSTHADLVVVHATVEDGRGAAVPDLQRGDFIVYEDNRPQEISFFSTGAPASIGLLVDNSTSMATKRERVVAAAVQFAELGNPDDEIFVLAFNEDVREAWAPRVIEESDIAILRATLLNRIAARGRTALYDAIDAALDRLKSAKHTRQVIVIISDGSDNASRVTLDHMLSAIRSSSAMIYAVALQDPVDRDGNPRLLERISVETGGESFAPRKIDQLPAALAHIARDIRATYTLGYVSTNQARDGGLRKLRVVARHPDGRRLKVQTRGGYKAPDAAGAPPRGFGG